MKGARGASKARTALNRAGPTSFHSRVGGLGYADLHLRLRVEERSARHLVAAVGLDEAHALRASAGLAYLSGLDAYELALLGDDHQLGLFVHGEDRDDLAR